MIIHLRYNYQENSIIMFLAFFPYLLFNLKLFCVFQIMCAVSLDKHEDLNEQIRMCEHKALVEW